MPGITLAALALAFLLVQRITVILDAKALIDRERLLASSYAVVLTGVTMLFFVDLPVSLMLINCGIFCFTVGTVGFGIEIGSHLWNRRAKITLSAADEAYVTPTPSPLTGEFKDATVVITDNIQTDDYERVYTACQRAVATNQPVTIRLVTTGGEVDSANAIIDLVERFVSLGNVVRVVASGKCMSAGTMILMAVPVENRYATKRTSFMIHHVRSSASLGRNERTYQRDDEYIELLTSRSNVSADSLRTLFKSERDYYLSPEEALTLGLIGQII